MIFLLTSFSFLTIPVHSRVLYSGGAFSSYVNRIDNLFWNPAGIGRSGYTASTHTYSGLIFGGVGMVRRIGNFNVGVGLQYMNSGNMRKTDMTGETVGNFSYYSLIPLFAGEYNSGNFCTGVKILTPYSKIDLYSSYGIGFEIGTIYNFKDILNLSLYLRNAGRQLKGYISEEENFPVEFRFGGLYKTDFAGFSLEFSSIMGVCTSVIYKLNENFEITAGYNNGLSDLSIADNLNYFTGFSFGTRIKFRKIILDIGAIYYGPIGVSKTIAIGYGG